MFAAVRRILLGAVVCSFALTAWSADAAAVPANAAKLNNLGVAYMNQQLMAKAVEQFDAAIKADPALATAQLNRGIALLNLQKLPEAQQALEAAAAKEPNNPRVWYNLGLLHRSEGKTQDALDDFQRVVKIDPNDPDAHYFLGTFYTQLQQYDKAIAEFQEALTLNPVHASAEFGLARAYQRSGNAEAAHQHLLIFEHLTRDHISSAMTLNYGEQGRYSTAQDVISAEPQVGPMIPVTLVAQPIGKTADAISTEAGGGGMCMIDTNGDGKYSLVTVGDTSPQPIRLYHNVGGTWTEVPPKESGLQASGEGVTCAAGDFDNDGKADLAVAMSDRVVLFRNLGSGKFADVTKSAGIQPVNHPSGMTFIDFDHDGDLDLFVAGKVGGSVLWRNNGNGTFTNWTSETGLGGEAGAAMLSDINNDRAVDLVVAGTGIPTVYLNPREGKFKPLPLYDASAKLPPAVGVYVFDFDKDGWMDVAVTHAGAPGVTLWRNVEGKRFERVPLPINDATRGWGVTAVDIDNDGWLDLAMVVQTAQGPQVRVLRNRGPQGFEDVSAEAGARQGQLDGAACAHLRRCLWPQRL